jgi:hypothetical protein
VKDFKSAKKIKEEFHNKVLPLTNDILTLEIVPELYITSDLEIWKNNDQFSDLNEESSSSFLLKKRKNSLEAEEIPKNKNYEVNIGK